MYVTARCSQGQTHILAKQEKSHSCGMACVGMVIGRMRGQLLDEKSLRQYSGVFEQGKYNPRPTTGYTAGWGTEMENLAIMLRKVCIPAKVNQVHDVSSPFKSAHVTHPVLAHVVWDGGGGHFVVVDGVSRGGRVVVCDPIPRYGLREVEHLPAYNPDGKSQGRFSGYIITTT